LPDAQANVDAAPPPEPGDLVADRGPWPTETFRDPVFVGRVGDGGVVSDYGPGADVSGAERAVDAMRQLLHDRSNGDGDDIADLYRFVGDLALLAHSTAEAVTILTAGLERLHEAGRLHHDDTQRPVAASAIEATLARLERARGALGAAGDVLDDAHDDVSHFYVMEPVLRVVPDPEPDDETPVGEQR